MLHHVARLAARDGILTARSDRFVARVLSGLHRSSRFDDSIRAASQGGSSVVRAEDS